MSAPFDYGGLTGYEPISDADRKEFHEQGFLQVRNVLTEEHRAALEAAVDRVYEEEKVAGNVKEKTGVLHLLGFLNRDELFAKLRQEGVANLAEVRLAYLEPSGGISIFRTDRFDPRYEQPALSTLPS